MIMSEIVKGMSAARDEKIQGLSFEALRLLEVRQVRKNWQRGQKEQPVKSLSLRSGNVVINADFGRSFHWTDGDENPISGVQKRMGNRK